MISTQGRADTPAAAQGRQAVGRPSPSSVVHRPLPERQVKDTRSYQIEQLKRRFSPEESALANGSTSLKFDLKPSDPDFPYDLDHLACEVIVPQQYPEGAPELKVRNKDVPRGFGINIERGWDKLVAERRGATLLTLTTALDRNLETFLSEQKVETVKLTRFTAPRTEGSSTSAAVPAQTPPAQTPVQPKPARVWEESFSRDDMAAAKSRRAQETRQLETRMGKLALYHKSNDGIVYTFPLEPRRRQDLPEGLKHVASVQLIVPLLYPLQPIRILLNDVESADAERLEDLFTEKAIGQKQMSLTSHLNYLSQNFHMLAAQVEQEKEKEKEQTTARESATPGLGVDAAAEQAATGQPSAPGLGKGHVQHIARPPEWSNHGDDEGPSDDSSESDEEYDSEDGGVVIKAGTAAQPQGAHQTAERGTALTFPSIELYGVELLQVSDLALSVKCQRCKTVNDISGMKDGIEKSDSCMKCSTVFTVRFRAEAVHQNSTRAGFLDLTGCTVADLLPSTFTINCGQCSAPAPPLVSVRGESVTRICRKCHARLTFKMPDVRFLTYTVGTSPLPPTTGPRRRQEKLGLCAGEPLPDRGTCRHYRRSYRWFRFGCCAKVYACDHCHDEAEGHGNEWANRMICGFCSREQRYSPEACAFCGRSVIGRRGKGYWEGGRGTRDPVLMRRGDKRKFRRAGGAGAAAAEAARKKGIA